MRTSIYISTILAGALFFGACEPDDTHQPNTGAATVTEMEQTEANQQRLVRQVPPPHLSDSQERRNLVRRLEALNDPNRLSWVYLLASTGQPIFYGPVRGKVSSLNSMLTTPDQVITTDCPGCGGQYTRTQQHVVASPDFDGSYGDNPQGIFWFDPSGGYHEWNGLYALSDQPFRLSQPPILIANDSPITPTPSNTAVR